MTTSFDLSKTFVHLGVDPTATPVQEFQWTPEFLADYEARFAHDGTGGRLVAITPQRETWTFWERHPAGEELVVLMSGRVDLVQQLEGGDVTIALTPGMAVVNPVNVWHRSVVHEPGDALFITPGSGTEHRPFEGAAGA